MHPQPADLAFHGSTLTHVHARCRWFAGGFAVAFAALPARWKGHMKMNGYANLDALDAQDAVDVLNEIAEDLRGHALILSALADCESMVEPPALAVLADVSYRIGDAVRRCSDLIREAERGGGGA